MNTYYNLNERRQYKPMNGLAGLSRKMATEGMVLLKNEGVLPIINQKISVFGRIQFDYYQSGTGSGGLVNVKKKYSILEGLRLNPRFILNQTLIDIYQQWVNENPFNSGNGMWASEPWSQIEMVLDKKTYDDASQFSDIGIVFIGRTAGEDKDNQKAEGSYLLSVEEELLIKNVSQTFKQTVVVLNVGNLIDLSFMSKYKIDALLLAYHGGLQGALAISDILSGYVSPSGKLVDTISKNIEDYPSNDEFGKDKNFYKEDIYVGYRYFNTFKKDAILYPFGFGLTYTKFDIKIKEVTEDGLKITLSGVISNIGHHISKEVIQVYCKQPQGVLGKPDKVLCGYHKTDLIKPAQEHPFKIQIDLSDISSYDEEGLTGHPSSYVLENGDYQLFVGFSSLDLKPMHKIRLNQTVVVLKASEALRPVEAFKRIKPVMKKDQLEVTYEDVPLRKIPLAKRIKDELPQAYEPVFGLKLDDVYNNPSLIESFVASLTDDELIYLTRGEGMSSPKVTPGTACAFVGVTDSLKDKGYPILCGADGPSGIRMDSGFEATSIPIGTLLASSFNEDLVTDLYYGVALEMQNYNIDLLLAPGMNIHRHPLNGRNFEYFSEDPFLCGHMAKSVIKGLDMGGVTGSLKHFACNNQEYMRFDSNSIVSERALREIYLKGFELAIKYSNVKAIMTSYNPINGIWAASNYDLNTTILRHDFNYKGIVITDWWAKMNDDQDEASKENTAMMLRAQNDIYMVITDALTNSSNDNTKEMLEKNMINRGILERTARNITNFAINSYSYLKSQGHEFKTIENNSKLKTIQSIKLKGKLLEGFSPDVMVYHVNEPIEVNDLLIESKHDYFIESSAHTIRINLDHEMFYIITSLPSVKANMDLDFTKYKGEFKEIKYGPFEKTTLNFKDYSLKSEVVEVLDGLSHLNQNTYIYFPIHVIETSKYIIEIKLKSSQSNLSQMPFSVLVLNNIKQTITSNGTDGVLITVSAQIIIEKGKTHLGLKFNRSGLEIKELSLIRHA